MAGIVHPLIRELARMRYLWQLPQGPASNRSQQVLGTVGQAPLDDALDRTLAELFPATANRRESAVA